MDISGMQSVAGISRRSGSSAWQILAAMRRDLGDTMILAL
jgi:hypothetical protein